jgi:hypothetical protein
MQKIQDLILVVLVFVIFILLIKETKMIVLVTSVVIIFTKTTMKETHRPIKGSVEIQTVHINSKQKSGKCLKYSSFDCQFNLFYYLLFIKHL